MSPPAPGAPQAAPLRGPLGRPLRPLLLALTLAACAGPIEPERVARPMERGERRTLRVVALRPPAGPRRFDRAALLALPAEALADTWALDWPLIGAEDQPGLLDSALAATPTDPAALDPAALDPAALDPAASDPAASDPAASDPAASDPAATGSEAPPGPDPAWRRWARLSLEDPAWPATDTLGALAARLGPDQAAALLALTLDRSPDAPLLPPRALALALIHQLLDSHPEARRRPGGAAADTPIPRDHLPLSLADLLLGGGGALAWRLGPHHTPGAYHPGAVAGLALPRPPEDLQVTVRLARPPALLAAIDLDAGESRPLAPWTPPQDLIDPTDPDWLIVEGALSLEPTVLRLDLAVSQSDRAVEARRWTTGPQPAPRGGADAWQAAPWSLERITIDAAWRALAGAVDRQTAWPADAPRLSLSLRAGWLALDGPGLPAGAYLWEATAEAAIRAARRGADAGAPLRLSAGPLPAGLDRPRWTAALRDALGRQPAATAALALAALAPPGPRPPDLALDLAADPPRLIAVDPAARSPGPRFFADPQLSRPLDAEPLAEGGRPWTPLAPGGRIYCLSASGRRYAVRLGKALADGHELALQRLD